MAGAAPNEGRHPSRSTATIIVTYSSYSQLTISLLSKRLCPSVCVWLVAFVQRGELVGAYMKAPASVHICLRFVTLAGLVSQSVLCMIGVHIIGQTTAATSGPLVPIGLTKIARLCARAIVCKSQSTLQGRRASGHALAGWPRV